MKFWLALLLALQCALAAHASEAPPLADDPVTEKRMVAISAELRCLVCQNQSIEDSDADLARDLRRIVRERLLAGDTDAEVLDYVVERYGEYVLLRPRVKPQTWLLWFGPGLALVVGGIAIALYVRRQAASPPPAALTADEERQLREIVND